MEKEVAVCMTNVATKLGDLAASFEGRNEYISSLCRYPLMIGFGIPDIVGDHVGAKDIVGNAGIIVKAGDIQ